MTTRVSLRCTLVLALILGVAVGMARPGAAQDLGRIVTPILTLDRDRLYDETLYGQRVNAELAAVSAAMAEETRKIEAALEDEERALTAQRATLTPEAFRALADAFDEKVQALRSEREAAEANIRAQIDAAQRDFFGRIGPALGALVRARGAVLIVDRRAVLLAAADVDVTEAAIARIDAMLGDGSSSEAPAPEPDTPAPTEDLPLDTIPVPDEAAPDVPTPEAPATDQ